MPTVKNVVEIARVNLPMSFNVLNVFEVPFVKLTAR